MGRIIPDIMENIKCLKPPTSMYIYIIYTYNMYISTIKPTVMSACSLYEQKCRSIINPTNRD